MCCVVAWSVSGGSGHWQMTVTTFVRIYVNLGELRSGKGLPTYVVYASQLDHKSPTPSTILSLPVPSPLFLLLPIYFWFFVLLLQICLSHWMAAPHTYHHVS